MTPRRPKKPFFNGLTPREGVFIVLLCIVQAVCWFVIGGALGRFSVPRIQVLDLHSKKWVAITPEKNMKIYCFSGDGFLPCARIFQKSDEVRDLLGPSIVVIPAPESDDLTPPKKDEQQAPDSSIPSLPHAEKY